MKIITIMPDFGMAPYGWIKDADDETCRVGGNLVDAVCGFGDSEYKVSTELEKDFAEWAMWFERALSVSDDAAATFDWPEFHRQGLALTIRLKAEIGDQARVMYDKPFEDPTADPTQCVEVLADGSLRTIHVQTGPEWKGRRPE